MTIPNLDNRFFVSVSTPTFRFRSKQISIARFDGTRSIREAAVLGRTKMSKSRHLRLLSRGCFSLYANRRRPRRRHRLRRSDACKRRSSGRKRNCRSCARGWRRRYVKKPLLLPPPIIYFRSELWKLRKLSETPGTLWKNEAVLVVEKHRSCARLSVCV